MKVRLRVRGLPRLAQVRRRLRRAALGLAALMIPASLAAYALGFWRIAADLNLTGEFAISQGLFSHWQVWIAMGAAIQGAAMTLSRYGRSAELGEDAAASL
jgi:hypothetical protein